tara:strand:- start:680 stop:1129 length:450 start_codon:yes stop_codon:yes gene_type:complete
MRKSKLNFFVGLITFSVLINFFLFNKEKSYSDKIELIANFNNIDGILVGSEVRVSGIKVGQVNKIEIENFKPKISFLLNRDFLLPDDSSISIQTDGLFGNKYLSIEPGGNSDFINVGERLMFTEDSILLEELLSQIISIGSNKNKENKL